MKSGGYAAILLMITDMRHTRPTFFFAFPLLPHFWIRIAWQKKQAALAYLESIIHDPYNLMQDNNEVEEEAFSDAEEFTNKPAASVTESTEK
jgi:hypothetical protein